MLESDDYWLLSLCSRLKDTYTYLQTAHKHLKDQARIQLSDVKKTFC